METKGSIDHRHKMLGLPTLRTIFDEFQTYHGSTLTRH